MVVSAGAVPLRRPGGLRLTSVDVRWYRLDARRAGAWSWTGFPQPRNRFDVPGRRVRYAARTERGAVREHFADDRRVIRAHHARLRVAQLAGRLRVVDLRTESTLDQLHLDAEVSTGRAERVLETCWALSARLLDWYGDRLHGIVYTSRTTPRTSANLAFFQHSPLRVTDLGRLDSRGKLLTDLVTDDGFRVDLPSWL